MAAQPGELAPILAAVGGTEERRIFNSGVHGLQIGQRWLEMPDPRELPRVGRAVIPLVRAGYAVIDEFVANRFPRRAAVIGALDDLSEPPLCVANERLVRTDHPTLR